MRMEEWGWNKEWEEKYNQYKTTGFIPGRIIKQTRKFYQVITQKGVKKARVSGHFEYLAANLADFPVIGDWVIGNGAKDIFIIEKILERRTAFCRKAAGEKTEKQVLAANIDLVFIVFGLDGGRNFNLHALERYLTLAWESGATPVVLLNKIDLCKNPDDFIHQTRGVAIDVPVYCVSATRNIGLNKVTELLKQRVTAALVGRSGVGKSALINTLLGEEKLATGEQRAKDLKGRHTTTHREIIKLTGQGLLLDSPGLRELQLWADLDSVHSAFQDISELAEKCRFRDCTHQNEPGCNVQKALTQGLLDMHRFENYLDFKRELHYLAARQDEKTRREERAKWKQIAKYQKELKKYGKR